MDKSVYIPIGRTFSTCDLDSSCVPSIASMRRPDQYARSPAKIELNLFPGESRGYWKYHTSNKWLRQAKAGVKINNEKATLLFDSWAKVSVIDTTFARKVVCVIDESQKQECVGIE